MKKVYRMIPFLMLLLTLILTATPALAIDDAVMATNTAAAIDWGALFKFIVFGTLGGLIASICLAIIILLPTAVRWLKDKNMLWLARTLVKAAEGLLGRYTGDEKFAKVCEWFEARGIKVNDAVKQMIYNAWLELNTQMIELGLKEASTAKAAGIDNETEGGAAEDAGSGSDDPFTDTDEAVRLE